MNLVGATEKAFECFNVVFCYPEKMYSVMLNLNEMFYAFSYTLNIR